MTDAAPSGATAPPTVPLSIVVPAYNEELRLPRTLREIQSWLELNEPDTEVIVVENGSTDGTVQLVESWRREHPAVRLIAGVPKGKGGAVRTGMLAACGAKRFLCDADMSMPIDQLDKFLAAAAVADIAIGSREAPGARRIGESRQRHFMGRVFNLLVRILAVPGLADTQCGFKMFSAAAAHDLFSRSLLGGWGFDAEVLYLARRRGYRVVEVPIIWHSDTDSRVRPVRDALSMVRDLLTIRFNGLRGAYDRLPDATDTQLGAT